MRRGVWRRPGELLLCSNLCLFFSLDSRALIIYFIFYYSSGLNRLHLRCLNLLIFYKKV